MIDQLKPLDLQSLLIERGITNALNRLRASIQAMSTHLIEVQCLDLGSPSRQDPLWVRRFQDILARHTSLTRALDSTHQSWEAALQHTWSLDDEHNPLTLYNNYLSHWETCGGDALDGEAQDLIAQADTVLQLLQPTAVNTQSSPFELQEVSAVPGAKASEAPDQGTECRPLPTTLAEVPDRSGPELNCTSGQATFAPLVAHPGSGPGGTGQAPTRPLFFTRAIVPSHEAQKSTAVPLEQAIRLPKFELPYFDGDIDAFPEFWDLFDSAVHSNCSLPAIVKFHHLRSRLRGDALAIIAGYDITQANYELAVNTLKETYYRPQLIRTQLSTKLQDLRPASQSALSQRTTLAQIKSLWAQMRKTGEQDSNIFAMRIIRQKFPQKTMEHLGQLETAAATPWQVPQLLDGLDKAIQTFETIADTSTGRLPQAHILTVRSVSFSPTQESSRQKDNSSGRRHSSPRPSLKRDRTRSPELCVFCRRRDHRSDGCHRVTSIRDRYTILQEEDLCRNCFARNHRAHSCDKPRCVYCAAAHHRSLCRAHRPSSRCSRSRSPCRKDTDDEDPQEC